MTPEIEALETRPSVIRLPEQIDVPVTNRILRLIDTAAFQRLSRISQLGLVSFVYPGAQHSRFEHSLGVYRNALLFIRRLAHFDFFREQVAPPQIEALVVAALLHDIGHWPFCHPIEDMGLSRIPNHETIAATVIGGSEISALLARDWNLDPKLLIRLIGGQSRTPVEKLLVSVMSGPIDIDKMDYLYRDSLHCGVPYGMNFDARRLINSIGINQKQNGIAISSKGKTAAEMMVFARYVMFSEVYWHHSVRSATAMLQRIFYAWSNQNRSRCSEDFLCQLDDRSFVFQMQNSSHELDDAISRRLVFDLFGTKRRLYKRLTAYNASQYPGRFRQLAYQPFEWLVDLEHRIAEKLAEKPARSGRSEICRGDILIDSPPAGLEVQFEVEINDRSGARSLEQISPVVKALAQRQFDEYVKRVRIFIHPRLIGSVDSDSVEEILTELLGSL